MTARASKTERPRRNSRAPSNRADAVPFGYPVLLVAAYLGVALSALFVIPALMFPA